MTCQTDQCCHDALMCLTSTYLNSKGTDKQAFEKNDAGR